MTREELVDRYGLHDDPVLFADGFDDCVIGVLFDSPGYTPRIAYSIDAIIEKLISQGLTSDKAQEHFSFNIQGAYAGLHTPAYVSLTDV